MKKVLSLDWVNQFRCIGGECPLTCCGGWNIALKENEIEMYENLQHPFREEILKAVDAEEKCMKQSNGRCILLTEDGWCRIVRECGEKYLSYTCTIFPRGTHTYGDTIEAYVEIVCPVVAGYLMKPEKIAFNLAELEEEAEEDVDYQLYDTLSLTRTFLIELFQSYDWLYNTGKCYILLNVLNTVKELYQKGKLNKENVTSQLLPYSQERNCLEIFQVGEQIASALELKAKRFYKIIMKLAESENLEILLFYVRSVELCQNLNCWLKDAGQLQADIQAFIPYFRDNYYCLVENYFVYVLFQGWIPKNLRMEKFGEKINMKIVEFGLIQLCAMSVWKQHGEITEKEYGVIIAGIERMLAHSQQIATEFMSLLEEEDSVAKILLLLLC
ncbi:MAG TPA: hypothetical protein DDY31_02695 [Lachnospiraceae bacterium]|nr:hypothetical protein [Lachnospiraceae bacterium]